LQRDRSLAASLAVSDKVASWLRYGFLPIAPRIQGGLEIPW